jgi:hypothetical protein
VLVEEQIAFRPYADAVAMWCGFVIWRNFRWMQRASWWRCRDFILSRNSKSTKKTLARKSRDGTEKD